MTLEINPFLKKLDYFLHQGIASYKFTGWKELAEMTNPGTGCFYFNYYGEMYAVVSLTDINGYLMSYNLMSIYFGLEYYDCILYLHGKTNSNQFIGSIIIPDEEWLEVTEGEGEEEETVAYAIPIWPVFFSETYDPVEDEYIIDEFPENDEVLMSVDFCFNPELLWNYVGTLGEQDYDDVYITGGAISGVNVSTNILNLPVKETTGDPDNIYGEPMIYINSYDQLVRVYAGGAWRTLLDFS